MALSNWDACAWDQDGNPLIPAVIRFPDGTKVEIFKNKAYIKDPRCWTEDCGHEKPIVMVIYEGDLYYKKLFLTAKRGRQESIYLYVIWLGEGDLRMYGIGAYGFKDESDEYIGIEGETVEDYLNWLRKKQDGFFPITIVKPKRILRYNQGDYYFHQHLKLDIQVTEVGRAKPPHISRWRW